MPEDASQRGETPRPMLRKNSLNRLRIGERCEERQAGANRSFTYSRSAGAAFGGPIRGWAATASSRRHPCVRKRLGEDPFMKDVDHG